MNIYSSKVYQDDLKRALKQVPHIETLKNKSLLITGATGLLGSFIVDMLMMANELFDYRIKIYAIGRSAERLTKRFGQIKTEQLIYVEHNVNQPLTDEFCVDYIIHAASNAYPAAFRMDPVGTMMGNIMGTANLLEYGKKTGSTRFLFVSSGEVYGQGDVNLDSYIENYSGYVDILKSRSCYPVSKRAAETLCCSFTEQYGLDTVIARPCHTYGPNTTKNDNRATVQFINNALKEENIVLKSAGKQMRSYCYVADCASGILTVLLHGKSCEAYNIANSQAKATIAEFAEYVAEKSGCKVIYTEPDKIALEERTPISKQVLDSSRLQELGWIGEYTVEKGIEHTLQILKNKTGKTK